MNQPPPSPDAQLERVDRHPTPLPLNGAPWTQFGIPEGFAFPKLYFNPPTNRLVVSVADKIERHHRRLFVRSITESVYRPLTTYADDITVSSVAVSASAPIACFISDRWVRRQGPDREYKGTDWHSIVRCDLSTLTVTDCASCGELVFEAPFTSGWLCDVLQIEGPGDIVIVRGSALQPGSYRAQYFIGRLFLATREISFITLLPDPFL